MKNPARGHAITPTAGETARKPAPPPLTGGGPGSTGTGRGSTGGGGGGKTGDSTGTAALKPIVAAGCTRGTTAAGEGAREIGATDVSVRGSGGDESGGGIVGGGRGA